MALPEYFSRGALAAAQVVAGLDADAIASRLEGRPLAIALGPECAQGEGLALADLTVRLCARLYPKLAISGPATDELLELATSINPLLESTDSASLAIAIGSATPEAERVIYAGSNGWDAHLSTTAPRLVGESANPFGAGAAACLAAANVFRLIFLEEPAPDDDVVFSTLELERRPSSEQPGAALDLGNENVLVGLGAIGNGAVWALARAGGQGTLTLVDHEPIELSNLQRYVLATTADVGSAKVEVAARELQALTAEPRAIRWDEFATDSRDQLGRVLVALDSAYDRVAVQAALPQWLANAWTQPGDLGVSVHPYFAEGACLACLYLPAGPQKNEDKLIAEALGLPPEREPQVRELLYTGAPPPEDLLIEVAHALDVAPEDLGRFREQSLRDLYVEGVCGGTVLSLDRVGRARQEVHVPLAHQSALAGVLLASRLVAKALGRDAASTQVTRLDVLRPVPEAPTQLAAKDPRGICICQDEIYLHAWQLKYSDGL